MVKICVAGSKGRIGSRIIALAQDDPELQITGGFDIGEDAEALIKESDCLIEFTLPEATMEHLSLCEKHRRPMVIGTTNLSDEDRAKIKTVSDKIPVVFSPNMSVGVNLLFKVVQTAAKTLGGEYQTQIVEAHHVNKKDAPSGTAKELAAIVKKERGESDIPIDSIREEDIVGEHTITFESPVDVIEFTHSAKTRDIFVKGALSAAKFVVTKPHGLFTMKEVLGL